MILTTIYFQTQTNDPAGAIGPIVLILIIVVIAVSVGKANNAKTKALEDAKRLYQSSLSQLKADPTNADLRQTTLQRGRTYSNLTRNNKGVTIFDEVALSNDINAACAGAANILQKNVAKPDQTIEVRLERLAELKAKGLIDEEEYAARREKVLDEV